MTEFSTHSFTDPLRSISVSSDGGAGVLKLDSLAQRIHRAVWQYGFAVLSVGLALGITSLLERRTTLRTPLFYIAVIISA